MSRILETLVPPLARLLLSAIFLASGAQKIVKWSETASQMESEGMVYVPLFLAGAIVCELLGGLLLLLGCWARLGALILVVYLIPVTAIFHDFWTYQGSAQQNQMIHFMKNVAILGGLLMVFAYGAGGISFDARSRRKAAKETS